MKKKHTDGLLKAAGMALAVGFAVSVLTGCSQSSGTAQQDGTPEASTSGKDLTVVISSDVGDLSPFGGDSGGRHHTYRMLYDCLCASTGLGQAVDELQGQMAKTVTVVDDYTVDVEIYDYIHDVLGNDITASDVVFSYNTAIASGTMEKLNGYLGSIEQTGDYSVRITLSSPSKGAMEWCLTTVPIISQSWYESASDADKTSNPATTGAYKLVETVASSHTSLEKDENYWQTDESLRTYYDAQTFDSITMNVITESAMRTIALQNGEADLVQNVSANEISSFLNEDGTNVDGWNVFPDENGRVYVLMFNNDNSVFADNKALRQAVLYGIDFEAVRIGYGNTATNGSVCSTFGPDVAGDFNEEWKNEDYYGYDLEKAKELMAEAGYPDGGFTVRLLYQNSTAATAGLTVLQANLADLGITVELTPADQALFNAYKYDDTQWDLIVDTKGVDFITAGWENVFDSRAFENGSACFTHDDTLQELLMAASNVETSSPETIDAFHDYLKEQAYGVGMFWNYVYYVAQDGITGFTQDGFGNLTPNTVSVAEDYVSVVK